MQTTNTVVRGYSEFFSSGFRAVTNRPQLAPPIIDSETSKAVKRRTRPMSMIVQSTTERLPSGRRSALSVFSSKLFERKPAQKPSPTTSQISSIASSSSSASDAIPELWVTAGGPFTPSAPNGSSALHAYPIDPFVGSPDTRSLRLDLSPDASPSRRESFLSIASSTRSSLVSFGARRERPTSIQTMPLPSRSRRSSFQQWTPSAAGNNGIVSDKPDFFLIMEEEPSAELASGVWDETDPDPGRMDWRQFHMDLLSEDS